MRNKCNFFRIFHEKKISIVSDRPGIMWIPLFVPTKRHDFGVGPLDFLVHYGHFTEERLDDSDNTSDFVSETVAMATFAHKFSGHTAVFLSSLQCSRQGGKVVGRSGKVMKWGGVRLRVAQRSSQKTAVGVEELVDFLYQDLPHLFDEQGIDRSMYDERVTFRDPITKHDSIGGYLFNIALLKLLFRPDFQLHHVKQVHCLVLVVMCYGWFSNQI